MTPWSGWFGEIDRSFAVMEELRRRLLEEGFGRTPRSSSIFGDVEWPRATLYDAGATLIAKIDLPGLGEKDVTTSLVNDVLSISGERKVEAHEGYTVHRSERPSLRFKRSFALPCRCDAEKTTAVLRDGVLTVTLPKAPEAQPRQIVVKTTH